MAVRKRSQQVTYDRSLSFFRLSPEIVIILITALVQAIFYYATRNAQLDEVKKDLSRVEKNVDAVKESVDKGFPAVKNEVKDYVKERDDFRAKQIDRVEEESRRRADELNRALKEQASVLANIERRKP